MERSYYEEKHWKDVLRSFAEAPILWMFVLPGVALESSASRVEKFAGDKNGADTPPSPFSFLLRPLRAIAGQVNRAAGIFGRHAGFPVGAAIAAAAPSLLAGGKVALALGFPWHALAASGSFAAMAGAGLGGLGAAVAVYPLAAILLASAVTLTMAAGLSAWNAGSIFHALGAGIVDMFRWRPGTAALPSEPPPAPASALEPEAVFAFKQVTEAMQREDAEERIRFMTVQRRKYPAEFAEAARLDPHTPELRKGIRVNRPLQLLGGKQSRRAWRLWERQP